MTIGIIFLLLAFVCFVLGAIPIPTRINLVSLGLAFWVLTLLLAQSVGFHLGVTR